MKAEMDRFAREKRESSEPVRDVENQPEWLRSEKKALQDRLCDAERQILQLKTCHSEELEKVVKEKDALAERLKIAEAGRKISDEELKRYATENVTGEEIRQSLEDEIRRLRQTVGQTEGEKWKKEERMAEYEERIHDMRAQLETYRECIQSLITQLGEEMSRHAPLYGAGLDALSMTELETISHIHKEALRQIHVIQQQHKGSPLSSPTHVMKRAPPSVMPNGVGMHHRNGHVNNELKKVVKEKNALAEELKSVEAGRKVSDEELKQYETENVTGEEIRQSLEDEIRRLRQTVVRQTEGEKRNERRNHFMQAQVEAYHECIQSLVTQLGEEMSRHAPLYGADLDAFSMKELETISCIHEVGLRQIHAIQQQRKGSPLSSPIVSPHTLPPHDQGLYPTVPPPVAAGLPPSVMPNGVGMHHSNRHVNGAMGPWFNHK